MSDPKCEDCRHFHRQPLTPKDEGACDDPSKIIRGAGAGNIMHGAPWVMAHFSCDNWTNRTAETVNADRSERK